MEAKAPSKTWITAAVSFNPGSVFFGPLFVEPVGFGLVFSRPEVVAFDL
jgi:hypothetical protein